MGAEASAVVEFIGPSSVMRERERSTALPIVGNGPPGTFVTFPVGFKVSLPTDQIVSADDTAGHAVVVFGGMQYQGERDGDLVFHRVREIQPTDRLSPERSFTMRLKREWVARVMANDAVVWP
jgi:hypothetical protein